VRALVTGGAGFIGSTIVDLLISEGHEVAVVDNLSTGKRENLSVDPGVRFYEMDIRDPNLASVFVRERPEVVFHQAAQMSVKVSTDDPILDGQVNVVGLINTLQASATAGVRKVVFASSGATYGNPQRLPMDEEHPQRPESPYGITKMAGEHYLNYFALDHGVQYTALRYGNVYGPRQDPHGEAGVVAIFCNYLLSGQQPIIHWDGEQTRDYVYVGDVARANLAAAFGGDGRCYCVGTGVGTSVNALYGLLCQQAGTWVEPRRAPRRPGDLRAAYFDTTRAREELGWTASVPLRDGLAATFEFFATRARNAMAVAR
jgi:UDP-glucose 4-epimerase